MREVATRERIEAFPRALAHRAEGDAAPERGARVDLIAQALSKIERGHARDLDDVHAMLERKLVTPEPLCEQFARIRLT